MEPQRPAGPVLSARLRFFRRRLIAGRAVLYSNRLCIKGWSFRGRLRETIDLNAIQNVVADLAVGSSNLYVTIDGETHRMQIDNGTVLWECTLKDLAGIRRTEALLPDKRAA